MTYIEAAKKIKEAKSIAIATHINPDGDAFGSVFALKSALSKSVRRIDLFADGKIYPSLEKLFNTEEINSVIYDASNYDLVIVLDLPTPSRLGAFYAISDHKNIIKIDHHTEDKNDVFLNKIIETSSASTCEMVYLLLKALKVKITPEIASYLYTGIATDTNSFLNSNTTARSLNIASELVKSGVDNISINQICFKSLSQGEWKLLQLLYKKAEIYNDYAIVCFNAKDLKQCGAEGADTSNYGNKLLAIDGIKIACSITNRGINTWRCSFRSLPGFDVSLIANQLGGGGHMCAAGCTLSGPEKKVKGLIMRAISQYLAELEGSL